MGIRARSRAMPLKPTPPRVEPADVALRDTALRKVGGARRGRADALKKSRQSASAKMLLRNVLSCWNLRLDRIVRIRRVTPTRPCCRVCASVTGFADRADLWARIVVASCGCCTTNYFKGEEVARHS